MNHRRKGSGFTLLELLCALAIVAIVISLVVPSFSRIIARNRLAITTNELLAAMLSARTLAITRNVPVVLCAGEPVAGCHGNWALGEWIVFVDADRSAGLGSADSVHLASRLRLPATVTVAGNGPFKSLIVFAPSGLARTASGAFAAGRLRVCVPQPIVPNTNDLILIGSGRAVSESRDFGGSCRDP